LNEFYETFEDRTKPRRSSDDDGFMRRIY